MQICLSLVAVSDKSHNKQLWIYYIFFLNQIKGNDFTNEQLSHILHNKVAALEGAGDNSGFTL